MNRDEIFSYIQSLIQQFYRSNDKALSDKIAQSTSFEDLELVPNEIARIIMSCEEKYSVDLGDEPYPSIQSVIDALMSVADVVNAAKNNETSANASEDDEKLPPPPETIEIPDMPAVSENIEINIDGLEDEIADEEENTKETTDEKPAEEEKSQEE